MSAPIPTHERLRGLMTTLVAAGHQLNMGETPGALASLFVAAGQLAALRMAVRLACRNKYPEQRRKRTP